MCKLRHLPALAFVSVATSTTAQAWEATYPTQSVRGPVSSVVVQAPATRSSPENHGDFTRRTVAFPSDEGAQLGTGWNYLDDKKLSAACVDFSTGDDSKYQNLEISLREATDEETLDYALNVELGGSAGGSFSGVTAKATADHSLNASRHISSKDKVFITHASVTSGITFAIQNKTESVRLKDEMERLAIRDPEEFRSRCGDGFVSSIGYGSDLYVMFHAHDLSRKDSIELSTAVSASAGLGDVFNASGKSKIKLKFDELSTQGLIDIYILQHGGKIKTVPVSLDDVRKKVQDLAGEEWDGRKAIFLKLTPYWELPNWRQFYLSDTSDLKQKTLRYKQRMVSVYFEALNIKADYIRDRSSAGGETSADAYFYDYRHQLRTEDVLGVADESRKNMQVADKILIELANKNCAPVPISTIVLSPNIARRRIAAERIDEKVSNFKISQSNCSSTIQSYVAELHDFDDFYLWTKLPLPENALSDEDKIAIMLPGLSVSEKKARYSQALFRHWVERINQNRCRLFSECLSDDDRKSEYNMLLNSINSTPGGASITQATFCTGEHRSNCGAQNDFYFDCDFMQNTLNANAAAADSICRSRSTTRNYESHIISHSERHGNRCGYSNDVVECRVYSPNFP